MRILSVSLLLLFPLLIHAQTRTITSVGASMGPDGNPVIFTTTAVITQANTGTASITGSSSGSGSSGSGSFSTTGTGSSSASGNSRASSNSTSTSTTTTSKTTSILPTAPTDVNGGGNGPHGAPSPGARGPAGVYGPDDSYTSSAGRLRALFGLVGLVGVLFGGAMVL